MENMELKQAVLDSMMVLANANKFNSLEKPKQLMLMLEPFTQENEMLTVTQKLKRNVANKRFKKTIEKLYQVPIMKEKK